jgi:hypothetical protein
MPTNEDWPWHDQPAELNPAPASLKPLNQAEICRRLHRMVDHLAEMPADLFTFGYPELRTTFAHKDGELFKLVVGVEVVDAREHDAC